MGKLAANAGPQLTGYRTKVCLAMACPQLTGGDGLPSEDPEGQGSREDLTQNPEPGCRHDGADAAEALIVLVCSSGGPRSVNQDNFVLHYVQYESAGRSAVRVRVHLRASAKRPEISDSDVIAAFEGALRSRARDTHPVQWLGVGVDRSGRLLEWIAVAVEPEGWLVFHAMAATAKVLKELRMR